MTHIRHTLAAVCTLALVAAPLPAHAQLGRFAKSVAGKAAEKLAKKPRTGAGASTGAMSPEVIGEPLDEATLTKVLAGLDAMNAHLAKVEPLARERQVVAEKLDASFTAHDAERQAFFDIERKADECRREFFDALQRKREPELTRKQREWAMDPKKQQEMMRAAAELAMKTQELIQAGDEAGANRLAEQYQREQMKELGIDLKADTAAAVAKCGAPKRPAFFAEQERLQAQQTQLDASIREIESGASGKGAQVSGLSASRFGLARERLLTWRISDSSGHGADQFGDEHALFDSHRAKIEQAMKAMR